jgi:FMN phosphatase YigB (HAD superfamily)
VRRLLRAVRVVLFDWGGTLAKINIDEDLLLKDCMENVQKYLREQGYDIGIEKLKEADTRAWADMYKREGYREVDVSEVFGKILVSAGVDVQGRPELLGGSILADCMTVVPYVELYPDTLPVLSVLRRRGFRTGIVSNNAFPIILESYLASHGLSHLFDVVIVSGNVGYVKPGGRIFREALRELDAQANEALFIGDDPEADIEGAKALGMRTVWMNTSGAPEHEGTRADYRIRRLRQILKILRYTGLERLHRWNHRRRPPQGLIPLGRTGPVGPWQGARGGCAYSRRSGSPSR